MSALVQNTPRMLHISSAICGTNGCKSFTKTLVHLHHFVVEDHQLANRGVEAHVLDVARDLDDGLVHHLLDSLGCGFINVNRSFVIGW